MSRKYLPEIRLHDVCVEGKMYRMDCNTCVCKRRTLLCTKMACMNFGWNKYPLRPINNINKAHKRPKGLRTNDLKVSDREFLMLPALAHHAAPCTPGEKYRVDCNVCICDKNENLECDKKMCVDHKTTRDLEAKKNSGQPCKENFETKKCVTCKCNNGKSECEPITNCQTEDDKRMLSESGGTFQRLVFDYKADECIPDLVYKEKCNKCYCQPDKTLRCTNKMCLNYVQSVTLEKQREDLEARGL